jgi:hypothetical protein
MALCRNGSKKDTPCPQASECLGLTYLEGLLF